MSDTPVEPAAPEDSTADAPATDAVNPDPPEEAPPPRQPDPLRDPIVAELAAALGEGVVDAVVEAGDAWVRVHPTAWRRTAQWCKDHGFTYFCFLSGIDWMPNPELSNRYEQVFGGEDEPAPEPEPGIAETAGTAGAYETGRAGGETRFQVFARLYDIDRKVGITLKADLDDTNPTVESIVEVYRGADWHERETWEMFGFDFVGHPGLRHLYLPAEFEGFPLRKDFPLLARVVKPWPGLVDKEPVPGEDEEEAEATA